MPTDSKENRLAIASRIKKSRKLANLKQSDVAKALEMTPQAISNYERGINNVPTHVLFKMANLYGTDYNSFIDNLPDPYIPAQVSLPSDVFAVLQYQAFLDFKLGKAHEFERLDILQQEFDALSPSEFERIIAKKYIEIRENNTDRQLAAEIIKNLPKSNRYIRLMRTIALFQAYAKVQAGYAFPLDENQNQYFGIQ